MYYMLVFALVAVACAGAGFAWWSASSRQLAVSETRLRKSLADQKALETFTDLRLFWHLHYAKAIHAASDAGARVIGLDLAFGVPVGTDRTREVCGRMWVGFESLGGEAALGQPIAAPAVNPDTGIVSQAFERAVIELHPENQAPCNVVAIPQ